MKYEELLEVGRGMSEKAIVDAVRGLAMDPRFAGIVGLIDSHLNSYVNAIASQNLAGHHGCLEHAAGSICALQTLQGVLREHTEPKRKTGMKRSPDEDE